MLLNDTIWLGTSPEGAVSLLPAMANRHGLIAGATGTGKTVSLQVLAEGFSKLGVPVFLADNKGEMSGLCKPAETTEAAASADNGAAAKAIAAAAVVGVVATVGAVGMAVSIGKSTEGMARQPEAAGKINSAMMLGLVFIETAIIYALIVAILIIFVL